MNPKYALLGVMYFVQGIPYGLQSGLLPIYFRMVGLSLTKISLTKMLYLPWLLKLLWAPLVDQYLTKKTWLVLSLGGLGLACLACSPLTPETQFLLVANILFFMNFFASLQDVAVDGIAVQLLGQEEIGFGNTIQVVAYKLGSVLAGGGLLSCFHLLGWELLFWSLAAVYLLAILYTWCSDLRLGRRPKESRAKNRTFNPWQILHGLLRVPGTQWIAGFVLIYKIGEQGASSMFPLFLLDHSFSPQKLGFWNGIVATVFSVTGSLLGGHLMSKRERHPLVLLKAFLARRVYSLFIQTLLTALYKDEAPIFEAVAVLSLCLQHFLAGVVTTLTFSIMMECTQKADESIQATHYSFLATLEVLGKLLFSTLVGSLVDWLGFTPSFWVCLALSAMAFFYTLQAPPAGI